MSQELARLLNLADKNAQQGGDQYITSEMVLLAALDDKSGVGDLFSKLQVQKDSLKRVIDQMRGGVASVVGQIPRLRSE